MKAIKIDVNGTITGLDIKTDPTYVGINDALGSEIFEIVRTRVTGDNGERVVLLVDESGLCKGLPYNDVGNVAALFLGYDSSALVGPVLIMSEGMTDEGPDLVDMHGVVYDRLLELFTVTSKQFYEEPVSVYEHLKLSALLEEEVSGPYVIKVEDKERLEEAIAKREYDLLKSIMTYSPESIPDDECDDYAMFYLSNKQELNHKSTLLH